MALTAAERAARLDERYGRTPAAVRRRALIALATIGAAIGIGYSAYYAVSLARQPLRFQGLNYHVASAAELDMNIEVTFTAGRGAPDAVCTVQAQNTAHAVVGQVDVRVYATAATVRTTVRVPTTERAVAGVLQDCVPAP